MTGLRAQWPTGQRFMEIIVLLTSVQIAVTTVFSLMLPQQRTSDPALLTSTKSKRSFPALLTSTKSQRSLSTLNPSAHYQHLIPALCVHNSGPYLYSKLLQHQGPLEHRSYLAVFSITQNISILIGGSIEQLHCIKIY